MNETEGWRFGRDFPDGVFVRRVLIVLGLVGLAYLIWRLSGTLLLVFGTILVAVILRAAAELLDRYTPLPERWSLLVATSVIFAALGLILLLFGAQIRGEIANVVERLPAALNAFTRELGVGDATEHLQSALGGTSSGSVVGAVTGLGQRVLGALGDLLLVVVAGIYVAVDPRLYRRGLVKLFPPSQHARVDDAMIVAGYSLKAWFAGQLVAMALVGVLSALLYWMIGLPAPVALGLIAGITNFIPFVGPILGAVPAVLLAFAQDGNALLYTLLAVLGIQQLESNLITPMIERRSVDLPPALALFSVVAFGVLFGFPGLFLAAPLTVVVFVLVKKLYVRETLGEATPIPGEEAARAEPTPDTRGGMPLP